MFKLKFLFHNVFGNYIQIFDICEYINVKAITVYLNYSDIACLDFLCQQGKRHRYLIVHTGYYWFRHVSVV